MIGRLPMTFNSSTSPKIPSQLAHPTAKSSHRKKHNLSTTVIMFDSKKGPGRVTIFLSSKKKGHGHDVELSECIGSQQKPMMDPFAQKNQHIQEPDVWLKKQFLGGFQF